MRKAAIFWEREVSGKIFGRISQTFLLADRRADIDKGSANQPTTHKHPCLTERRTQKEQKRQLKPKIVANLKGKPTLLTIFVSQSFLFANNA